MGALGAAAAAYARRGMMVFPLKPHGKTPLTAHGFKDASNDVEAIKKWWAETPAANIGIATGKASGVWVLDIDGDEGRATLAALEAEHGALPKTPMQSTGKGAHYLFKWVDGVSNSASKLGPGLDVRGAGGYIVAAPSVHPSGAAYAWTSGKCDVADAPDWLLSLVLKAKLTPAATAATTLAAPPKAPDFAAVPEAYGRKALEGEYQAVAAAAAGTRNETLNKAAFNLGQLTAVDAVRWPDVERTLLAASASNGQLAEEGPQAIEAVIRSGFEAGLQHPREVKPSNKPPRGQRPRLAAVGGAAVAIEAAPQPSPYSTNKDGGLRANSIQNALMLMQENEELNGLFALNVFTNEVVVTRRPPWAVNGYEPKALEDTDVTFLAAHLERLGQTISLTALHAVVHGHAKQHYFDPVRDALTALEWDGKERLDFWLSDYMEADETRFVREVGAKWLIGAAARIMAPGSKVDTMLILEGPQGLKKSTALAALATIGGQEYFADKLPALETKDAALEIQGKIIVEIAELDALRRAEVSQIKAYLSQRFDRFRPPYGRTVIERPRRCVFAGTVNPGASGYLSDPTGGRRFWPVTVRSVALEDLKTAAPQLWAEALHRYRSGESWWINEEAADDARAAQRDRYDPDVWADKIDKAVSGKTRIKVADILEAIGVPASQWTDQAKKRVGAHLRFHGWERRKVREGEQTPWAFIKENDDGSF